MKNKLIQFLKLIFGLIAMALIVMTFITVRSCRKGIPSPIKLNAYFQKEIDLTPSQIRAVEQIGEWEFLCITDEEMVDTIITHWFSRDDRLVRIYQGTLRLGIDFGDCEPHWATSKGDTAILRLPPVKLLDRNFIDEARARSFFERGEWDAKAKEDLYRKAQQAMIERCVTPENIQRAEENARTQVEALFHTLGYEFVRVVTTPSTGKKETSKSPSSDSGKGV